MPSCGFSLCPRRCTHSPDTRLLVLCSCGRASPSEALGAQCPGLCQLLWDAPSPCPPPVWEGRPHGCGLAAALQGAGVPVKEGVLGVWRGWAAACAEGRRLRAPRPPETGTSARPQLSLLAEQMRRHGRSTGRTNASKLSRRGSLLNASPTSSFSSLTPCIPTSQVGSLQPAERPGCLPLESPRAGSKVGAHPPLPASL